MGSVLDDMQNLMMPPDRNTASTGPKNAKTGPFFLTKNHISPYLLISLIAITANGANT